MNKAIIIGNLGKANGTLTMKGYGERKGKFVYDIYVLDKSNKIKESYQEFYLYEPQRDIPDLKIHCEGLIEFIESNKEKITDKKIFNQHEN